MTLYCKICNRELNKSDDPLSDDCGGDCWGCIGEIEADSGNESSLNQVRQEYRQGLRRDWIPSPKTSYSIVGDFDENCEIILKIRLIKPLGEPWCEEPVILRIFIDPHNKIKQTELKSSEELTDNKGIIIYKFKFKPVNQKGELWFEIKRKNNSWSFPIHMDVI